MVTPNSTRFPMAMFQLGLLMLGLLVAGNWAAPSTDELREIYIDTCQSSCALTVDGQELNCQEKFCPNYVSYLFTGKTLPGSSATSVSSDSQSVSKFCATWILNLIQELGWNTRNRLNLRECICAAGDRCYL